jgi:hypothetical protein
MGTSWPDLAAGVGLSRSATSTDILNKMCKLADDASLTGDIAKTLAEALDLRQQATAPTTPATSGKTFCDAVDELVASKKLSYGDAARIVARDNPELYDAHRAAADLNRVRL